MESSLRLLEALERAPELKRRLAVRVVRDILDSEAFMEAYPRVDGPAENANEELAKIIVRLFRKNRTSEEDAEAVLERAGIIYDGMHSREGESARGQANDKE
jgi:transposase